jgi:hypothetical protein
MSDFMKKPCANCPYRTDVKPFLHPERGEELAYIAQNPYNTFTCHKTLSEGRDGDLFEGSNSKVCAGFLSLQHNENGETWYDNDGFEPSPKVYETSYDMAAAYEEDGY